MSEPASPDAPEIAAAFLDVEASATGRRWSARLDTEAETRALAIAQAHGLSDVVSRVLAGRGVSMESAQAFLAPKLRDLLPDPHVLRDMEPALERLAQAVARSEKVAIFGDYDVDGAASAALLASFLRACGVPFQIHIPDRITEGYGPNSEAIEMLAREGARLLVAVDCGTASHEPFAHARALGLDVVALDHHQAPETLPETIALVNPNRQDDLSGLGHLCAAGVVFMTLVGLARRLREEGRAPDFDLMGALDIVALATVADVVPLVGLNRAFVRQGLSVMRARARPGLTALLDVAGLAAAPQAWHLGYLVGPRINAGGRIGDAALGARLLLTEDQTEAATIAAELDRLNRERQIIEQEAVAEALAQADKLLMDEPDAPIVATFSPEWHPGVVGLVAARLKERFRRPAFAFAVNIAGDATGSGRSIAGVDLGRAVRAAVEAGRAIKGGGHAMAAGVTIAPGGFADFAAFLAQAVAEGVASAQAQDTLTIDAIVTAGGASAALVAEIEQAGPFGAGCPEPVFALPRHRIVSVREVGSGGHLRVRLASGDGSTIDGVAFRAAGQPLGEALSASQGETIHLAGTLARNDWGGRDRAELRIIDLAKPA
ncbi:MAG: single-stranded-DNA-specific exonuclease RecJ [Salinarimonadaceae bacterium]|nr:MAG: single-stranded-DNA-specific exonuclease RecJ [Salinarimonadaceae bacterium]